MADLEPARALAERIIGMLADHEGSPINSVAELAELLDQFAADVRESERQACIEYSYRTEGMYRARAQSVADNSDRADSEAASDDEERHEMRAEGARAVAHGLRHAAHRAGVAAAVRGERVPVSEPASVLAARLLDLLPGADLPRAVELIEADRAAVREAALREAIETLRAEPMLAYPSDTTARSEAHRNWQIGFTDGARALLEELEKLFGLQGTNVDGATLASRLHAGIAECRRIISSTAQYMGESPTAEGANDAATYVLRILAPESGAEKRTNG